MAKKKSKGSKKASDHSKNLAGAMKSVSTSKTPIATLYPKKVTVGSSRTSPKFMQRGTKSPSKSAMPQKLLLQITNPGSEPTAPTNPGRPGNDPSEPRRGTSGVPTRDWLGTQDSRTQAAYDSESGTWARTDAGTAGLAAFTGAVNNYTSAVRAYNTYVSDLSTYNTSTLPDWQRASAQYTTDTATNVKKTTKYNRDVTKFIKSLDKKSKVSTKKSKLAGGSRGSTRSKPGGSR
jgi:hypothetical protein